MSRKKGFAPPPGPTTITEALPAGKEETANADLRA